MRPVDQWWQVQCPAKEHWPALDPCWSWVRSRAIGGTVASVFLPLWPIWQQPPQHGSFARTFYSARISEKIANISQNQHFYLEITYLSIN